MFLKVRIIHKKTPVQLILFFNKVKQKETLIKKETLAQLFSCEICENLRPPFL